MHTYQVAFWLAVGTLLAGFLFPASSLFRIIEPIFLPLIWLSRLLPDRGTGEALRLLVLLVPGLAYLFGLWFLGVWGWRRSSVHFKLALGACALVSIGGYWGFNAYGGRVDWTSRGLNPDCPGFKPAVVLLAGTFDYRFTDWETSIPRAGTARFEIRMRGADYYYAERWTGHLWKYHSWDNLTIRLPDFAGAWNRSYAGSGHHGRGGSWNPNDDSLLVARRLWKGPVFVGATGADKYSLGKATESFFEIKQYGRFQIPHRIEWTEGNRSEVLHVRRVEFLNSPGTNWFHLIKQKYFDHSGESLKLNLNEAGWSGEQRP